MKMLIKLFLVIPLIFQNGAHAALLDEDDVYYKNCSEARAAGAAPLKKGSPGYRPALDRDGDGIACE